jgi:glucose/arabinose dehydrogenase
MGHAARSISIGALVWLLAIAHASPGLQIVASGFAQPLGLVAAFDGSGRLFVVEQRGTVVEVSSTGTTRLWLDLQLRTAARGERGLLGLALHPEHARNGRLFVHYSDHQGATTLSELRLASNGLPDPTSEVILYSVPQRLPNHNGGDLAFGPDGMLYLALGDEGGGGDPYNHGQNRATPYGALLRFDVDRGGPGSLTIPADNPFVADPNAAPEIWAYGLRNPWRIHFDRRTGDLWIADVGQNAVEEINLQPAASRGGENYGWRTAEGDRCFDPPSRCDLSGSVAPVLTYRHDSGWGRSVSGGVVPYGDAAPSLVGRYLFGDFVSGRVFISEHLGEGRYRAEPLLATGFQIAAFGLDEALDAYVLDYAGGVLYRIVDADPGR